MKTLISNLPLTTVPLYCSGEHGPRFAQNISPEPTAGGVLLTVSATEILEGILNGWTTVTLFETRDDANAFCAGFDAGTPGDGYSWQQYTLKTPIEGCTIAVVFHNSDGDDGLVINKYATPVADVVVESKASQPDSSQAGLCPA